MRKYKENRVLLDKTLGSYLREVRKRKDYTLKELSGQLKISVAMLGYMENGERMPTMQTLLDYASHFSIDINHLIEVRIVTVENTVKQQGDKTPQHVMNEYHLKAYYTTGL